MHYYTFVFIHSLRIEIDDRIVIYHCFCVSLLIKQAVIEVFFDRCYLRMCVLVVWIPVTVRG